MTRLVQLADELRNLHAEIAKLEFVISRNPESASLQVDYNSLSKRQRRLEREFRTLADQAGYDVVSYRMIPMLGQQVPLRALTKALDRFQAAISTIYDAFKTGPKQRPRLTAETYAHSGFDFGYSFSGSLGIALTVPNERMLLDKSDLDYAITEFFSVAETTSRDMLIEFARRFGVPSIRRLYEWSSAHADFEIAADINWLRGNDERGRFQIAPQKLNTLKALIEETSETTDEFVDLVGRLPGLDTENKTFHLIAPGGEDISGRWSDAFSYSPSYVLDATYEAQLIKRIKIHYAFEKEETDWFLVSLKRVPSDAD